MKAYVNSISDNHSINHDLIANQKELKTIIGFRYYTKKGVATNIRKKTIELKSNKYNLTIKEIAILGSLAKGNSYKMIAEDCNIATNTVREHIRHIFHKLNVHSSIEAVLLALKEKLVSSLLFYAFFSHDNAIDSSLFAKYLYPNL